MKGLRPSNWIWGRWQGEQAEEPPFNHLISFQLCTYLRAQLHTHKTASVSIFWIVCQVTTSQKPAWLLCVLFVHLACCSPFPTVPFYMKHTVASKPCYCLFSNNVLFYMAFKSMLEHKKNHMWRMPSAQSYILHMLHSVQYHNFIPACMCVLRRLYIT